MNSFFSISSGFFFFSFFCVGSQLLLAGSLVAPRRLLVAVASLAADTRGSVVAAGGLQRAQLIVVKRAWLQCGMRDFPGPEIEPVYLEQAGRFSTTELPRESVQWPLTDKLYLEMFKRFRLSSPLCSLTASPLFQIDACRMTGVLAEKSFVYFLKTYSSHGIHL